MLKEFDGDDIFDSDVWKQHSCYGEDDDFPLVVWIKTPCDLYLVQESLSLRPRLYLSFYIDDERDLYELVSGIHSSYDLNSGTFRHTEIPLTNIDCLPDRDNWGLPNIKYDPLQGRMYLFGDDGFGYIDRIRPRNTPEFLKLGQCAYFIDHQVAMDAAFYPMLDLNENLPPDLFFLPNFHTFHGRYSPAPEPTLAGGFLRNLAYAEGDERIDNMLIRDARLKHEEVKAVLAKQEQRYREGINKFLAPEK